MSRPLTFGFVLACLLSACGAGSNNGGTGGGSGGTGGGSGGTGGGASGTGGGSGGTGGGTTGTGGGGTGTGGGAGLVTCQISAATPAPGSSAGSITAKGTITCNGRASLSIKVCMDYRSSSASNWVESGCVSGNQSDVTMLERETGVGCSPALSRDYQLRASGTVDGQALNEVTSMTAVKPTCP